MVANPIGKLRFGFPGGIFFPAHESWGEGRYDDGRREATATALSAVVVEEGGGACRAAVACAGNATRRRGAVVCRRRARATTRKVRQAVMTSEGSGAAGARLAEVMVYKV